MHGMINRAIERFVRDTYGRDIWGTVMRRAGLDYSEFEAMLTYDAKVTHDVLSALGSVLDRPQQDILEDIGTYLVSHPKVEALRRLLRFGGPTFTEFLHSLDDLPARARLAVPDLVLPDLELREHGSGHFSAFCRGQTAGWGHVVVGLLRALADDYGALAVLEHKGARGDAEVIDIQLLAVEHASGRRFDLGVGTG
ncbi:heme NO-binding protein [Pelagivirga sediminicola]|uniref:Heme NO-binding protein n=1 Tax=Pelagivirga sediminicola TaxID=2170575 RepID=A0A2T7G4A8_9RHOB|nr:heme NO-binding domain-containing protein [Pelagivirga sediminicola]PVA09273.1 heme NO-binding protein [Pelagivirga sediminicola]